MTWLWDHLALVAFLALGFFALWQLLLPTRRQTLGASITAGVLALIIAGWTLIQVSGAGAIESGLLFFLFAGVAAIAAACMITQHNPVYAALWFALVILSVCGLFLLQAAPFLAAATVIVYAGAIIVTFLFVIMLAQQSGYAAYDRTTREPLLATLAGFILLGALLDVLENTYASRTAAEQIEKRLIHVRELINAKSTETQIDNAMYLAGSAPVTKLLEEEIQHVPNAVWPAAKKSAIEQRFRSALDKWTAGKTTPGRDAALMDEAVTIWQEIALEVKRDAPHPSTLPIPDRVQNALSTPTLTRGLPSEFLTQGRSAREAGPEPGGKYVAGLGRSLFGQYLYAVELAGALLLIATIGAIAITQRPGARRREASA